MVHSVAGVRRGMGKRAGLLCALWTTGLRRLVAAALLLVLVAVVTNPNCKKAVHSFQISATVHFKFDTSVVGVGAGRSEVELR